MSEPDITDYREGVRLVRQHAPVQISENDAHEAVRNLIAFGRLALDIRRGIMQDAAHGKHR